MSKLFQTKALVENIEGKLMAVASEEIPDRDGDIISIDGWDLKNFKKNPVLLFLHNLTDRALPIGKAENIRIKEINGKKKLVFEPVFEEITELGQTVAEFFRQGFMKAFSVGFLPIEAQKISNPDEWPPRFKFIKQELLEISAVPVPALPTATIIDQSKNLGLNMKVVKSLVDDMIGKEVKENEEDSKEPKDKGEQDSKEAVKPDSTGEGNTDNSGEPTDSNDDDPKTPEEENKPLLEKPAESNEHVVQETASISIERLDKLEAMIKHLIGEIQAARRENKSKNLVTLEVLSEALGKFEKILPRAIQKAREK